MDRDEELLTKLQRCEAIVRYTIFKGEDGLEWELCCGRDSSAKLNALPQWSLVPPSEFFQQFIFTPEHRVWFHNYGLLIGRKDGIACSLAEHITPLSFAEATRFGFTDWWREGIPEDPDALLRNFVLEPELRDRDRIVPPKGARRLPRGPFGRVDSCL